MKCIITSFAIILLLPTLTIAQSAHTYPIVDTNQIRTYNNTSRIKYPLRSSTFFGQDAQYQGLKPSYQDNHDGTITDLNTSLMWQKEYQRATYQQAVFGTKKCRTANHNDWRLPTIKELYSLIDFSGSDPDPRAATSSSIPFIDTSCFNFTFGDTSRGERIIDAQYWTSTIYTSTTMNGNKTAFGINFADGRIKGYPTSSPRDRNKQRFVRYVRGNTNYGKNNFIDNSDGTITDKATGLIWAQNDSGEPMPWQEALKYCEQLKLAGHTDWRLPNAKELQSIVDYSRSPDATRSPAINPIFNTTTIKNEGNKKDYPQFWTSTTHKSQRGGTNAVYIAFGRALGFMSPRPPSNNPRKTSRNAKLMDVHGAGAQRSDMKSGNPDDYPQGHGPQGDVIRIENFVRPVRGGAAILITKEPSLIKTEKQVQNTQLRSQIDLFIKRLDRNGDNKISKSEFDGPREHFSHIDRNGDNYITADEAPTGPPKDPPSHESGSRPPKRHH
ncbi:Lcl domain-containing protein [Poriferisphaera sp. WC338]|uniref:Lcl C-terminal domain-containing protein n=1 Tax=Poriferisphaera sp. WC338 TaxID=3425129 RepID=UPI003D815054